MIWFLLWPFWLFVNVTARVFAPVLPRFAKPLMGNCDNNHYTAVEPRLTGWLSGYMTDDNSLWGDAGHKERTPDYKEISGMAAWLQRNPAIGFEATTLSADLTGYTKDDIKVKGDPQVQDAPNGKEGYCFVKIGPYWNLVYIKKIGTRCIKLDLGWQLKTFSEGHPLTASARYALSLRFPLFKVAN